MIDFDLTDKFVEDFRALEAELHQLRAAGPATAPAGLDAERVELARRLGAALDDLRQATETADSARARLVAESARRRDAESRLKHTADRLAAAEALARDAGRLKDDLASARFDLEMAQERIRRLRQENDWLRDELQSGGRNGHAGR